MLGVAAAVALLEKEAEEADGGAKSEGIEGEKQEQIREDSPGISELLSSLSIKPESTTTTTTTTTTKLDPLRPSNYIYLPPVPPTPSPEDRGKILASHAAVQYVHSPPAEMPFPGLAGAKRARVRSSAGDDATTPLRSQVVSMDGVAATIGAIATSTPSRDVVIESTKPSPSRQHPHETGTPRKLPILPPHPHVPTSSYLRQLTLWAINAPERIRTVGCEIPNDQGLNVGDLYLGPGSVDAIEGCVSWAISKRETVATRFR
jgi:hypothetical protein